MALLIGISVPLMNIGAVWPMARHAKRGFLGELVRNPLIIATAGGLSANLAGFTIPHWAEPTVVRIGGASLALGLMAAGAGMQITALNHAKLLAVAVLLIRHLLMPLWALLLCHPFGLNAVQGTILLMFSALPTASSAYVLASRMGYDGAFVAALVTASTVLGMVSLPFALGVLRSLV
jgi:predicted permease